MEKERKRYDYHVILTNTVSYRDYDKCMPLKKFDGFAGAMVRDAITEKTRVDISPVTGTQSVDDYAKEFFRVAPFLKDPGFQEEMEYRIVALAMRLSHFDGKGPPPKPIKFRVGRNGTMTPYIELFNRLGGHLPIKSILIGPHPHQTLQMRATELLLEQYRLRVPIRASGIPFRE